MQFKISTLSAKKTCVFIVQDAQQIAKLQLLNDSELAYAKNELKNESKIIDVNQYGRHR